MKLKKRVVSIVLTSCIFLSLSPINVRAIEKKVDVLVTKESSLKENNTNTISYSLNILNQGIGEIDLSKLEIDYWYTDDKVSNEVLSIDWSSMQKDKIKAKIVKNENVLEDCNGTIKLQFLDNYSLKQGESQQIHIRLYNSNYLEYNQLNDYSYINGITVKYNGEVIQGNEPKRIEPQEDTLKLEGKMYNKYRDENITSLYPWFLIGNYGEKEVELSKVRIKYYYSNDGQAGIKENFICDWASIGKEEVVGELKEENGQNIVDITFNTNKKLKSNQNLEVHTRINKEDWSYYIQSNDRSFNSKSDDYIEWDKFEIYYDSKQVWGEQLNQGKVNSNIAIIDSKGNAIEGANVEIYKQDILANSGITNEDGNFICKLDSRTEYKVVVKKDGYKVIEDEVLVIKDEKEINKIIVMQNNIGDLYVKNKNVLVGQKIDNRISLPILFEDIDLSNDSVNLYKKEKNIWSYVGNLLDNGSLSNGDEIKGDNIYSFIYSENTNFEGLNEYKVIISTKGGYKKEILYNVEVIKSLTQEDINNMLEVDRRVDEIANEYILNSNEKNVKDIQKLIISAIQNETYVDSVEEKGFNLEIKYKFGVKSLVQILNYDNYENMPRGASSGEFGADVVMPYNRINEIDNIKSNKMLLWAPFDSDWGSEDEKETIKNIAGEGKESVVDLNIISDENADIASLKNLTDYGVVVLSTHGINGEWIATGEKVTISNMIKYINELSTGQLMVAKSIDLYKGKSYGMNYLVGNKWIEQNVMSAQNNTIVVNNSCESTKTDLLWNSLKGKGVKTYLGYSDVVTNGYIILNTSTFLSNLILNQVCVAYAFTPVIDKYFVESGIFEIRGQTNLAYYKNFTNPNSSFELGLAGWEKDGDGRSISALGSVLPTHGSSMGIVSTGLGYTIEHGNLKKSFYIPEDAKEMSFDWNYLSEEFLEYIGSRYDDPFKVRIQGENGSEEVLNVNINTLAAQFGANKTNGGELKKVSPEIEFDQGDVWMTDWQICEFDISKFSGTKISIEFYVEDQGDTSFTTAVLIDNIRIDGEIEEILKSIIPVNANIYNSDIVRKVQEKSNKSYVFYSPSDFSQQAEVERKRIKQENGYESIESVIMIPTRTEEDFIDGWSKMVENVDTITMLFHSRYYAIMIDSDKKENLTTSIDGKLASDPNATYIGALPKKNINYLKLYTCNAGLIDAVDLVVNRTAEDKSQFKTNGNVAQSFLETQNINKVNAMDGSLSYTRSLSPRLSFEQGSYVGQLEELEDYDRVHIANRMKSIVIDNSWPSYEESPLGMVEYRSGDDGNYFTYTGYLKKSNFGIYGQKVFEEKIQGLEW